MLDVCSKSLRVNESFEAERRLVGRGDAKCLESELCSSTLRQPNLASGKECYSGSDRIQERKNERDEVK